jgi:hypothetical protein
MEFEVEGDVSGTGSVRIARVLHHRITGTQRNLFQEVILRDPVSLW